MKIYIIPNKENSNDTTTAITETEAKWIKKKMPTIELDLVGWLTIQPPADVMAIITGDLREISGVTQATRTRLRQRQLIHTQADPMSYAVSLQRWHITPRLQEDLDATRANVLGAANFITIRLARTGTVWKIAPLYFNEFRQRLLNLAPKTEAKPKLPPLKPSPLWSFTPKQSSEVLT